MAVSVSTGYAGHVMVTVVGQSTRYSDRLGGVVKMVQSQELSRRGFFSKTAAVGTAGLSASYLASAQVRGQDGAVGANDKIHVGLIGCGGMGRGNLRNCAAHPDVVVTALCDVQQARVDATQAKYKATAKNVP